MAIQDLNSETAPAQRSADPRRTMCAPFPARAEYDDDLERPGDGNGRST